MSDAARRLLEDGLREERAGYRARAARLYRRVPEDDACFPEALTLLGRVRFEQGWTADADRMLRRSLGLRGDQSDAWTHLGDVLRHMTRLEAAAVCYRRALTLSPDQPDGFRGLFAVSELLDAPPACPLKRLRQIITVAPLDRAGSFEIGTRLWQRGEFAGAAGRFHRVLVCQPSDTAALFRLGNVMRDRAEIEVADRLYRRTLCLVPGAPNVLNNRGLLAYARADWRAAESCFAAARTGDPAMAVAWANQARALNKLGRDTDATRAYRRALALAPADQDASCEIANLAGDDRWIRRARAIDPLAPQPYTEFALQAAKGEGRTGVRDWLRRAAVLKPDDATVWHRLCTDVGRVGEVETAATYGAFATYIDDSHVLAHLDRAFALLALERFEQGWQVHRRRLEVPHADSIRRAFAIPEWTDQDLDGRQVLLWSEQGIGDEVQFLTLARHLERLGATLTLIAEPRLRPILIRSFPNAQVPEAGLPTGEIEDHYGADLHLALGDLPHRLGLFCGGDARPEPWIVPDAARVTELRSALETRHPGKRLVGITWRSIAPKTGGRRTIPPDLWTPLAGPSDVAFVSLQYGATVQDVSAFERDAGLDLDLDHGIDPLVDLDGLTALIAAIDLVICPANNTVHFAGALSKPCWTLLPTKPDWRWGLTRSDSLWYPNASVYRQTTEDAWAPVMRSVADDLRLWAESTGPRPRTG